MSRKVVSIKKIVLRYLSSVRVVQVGVKGEM